MIFSKLLRLGLQAWQRFGEDNASQMAAAITYYVLFAIVPLTMLLFSVANVVVPSESRDDVTEWVEDFLNVSPEDVSVSLNDEGKRDLAAMHGEAAPTIIDAELANLNNADERLDERLQLGDEIDSGDSVEIAGYEVPASYLDVDSNSFVSETMSGAASSTVPLGLIGLGALAFSASIAFSAIRRSLNFVWNAQHRPFAQQRLMEISMLIGLVVLLGASIAATTVVQVVRELSEGSQNPITSSEGFIWLAIGYLLPWALTFLLLTLAYRFVPNAEVSLTDVWGAAVLASLAIEILKYGHSIYVVNFSNYGVAYGALGGVLLFMFFVWLSSYIFLMGAELASEYPRVFRTDVVVSSSKEEDPQGLPQTIARMLKGLFVAK